MSYDGEESSCPAADSRSKRTLRNTEVANSIRRTIILAMNDHDEAALARKLAEKHSLNVPERRSLQSSGISASALVAAIREILQESPWYPPEWPRDEQQYHGTVITPTPDGFRLQTCCESGVCRFSLLRVHNVATLEEAVRDFLTTYDRSDNIDGIPIDWSR